MHPPESNQRHLLRLKSIPVSSLLLIVTLAFYVLLFSTWTFKGVFPLSYGTDYLAFWSIGRIANEQGYGAIYDVEQIKDSQREELQALGVLQPSGDIVAIPAPIFPIFVPPFQALSLIDSMHSYWLWTALSFALLVGYTLFFLRNVQTQSDGKKTLRVLFILLLSYAIFDNFVQGQVQVLLLVCSGEFLRNALHGRPLAAGIWLGGLLLKPQVLILVIPALFLLRNWKTVLGFFITAGLVLVSSLGLSGTRGVLAMIVLWTRYSAGIATTAPERMINWRMLGENLNALLPSPLAWGIAMLGILFTLAAVVYLIRQMRSSDDQGRVIGMLGIFAATLAVTWHAHYHMAMVLVPFLAYAALQHRFSPQILLAWTLVTPLAWILSAILGLIIQSAGSASLPFNQGVVIALSGFVMNLVLLAYSVRILHFSPNQRTVLDPTPIAHKN